MRRITRALIGCFLLAVLTPLALGQKDRPADSTPKTVGTVTTLISRADGAKADAVHKMPWQWTDEERIAVRFDPLSIADRNAALRGMLTPNVPAASVHDNSPRVESVIDGKRNPELFLAFELYDNLVAAVDPRPEIREKARAYLGPGIAAQKLDPAAFWRTLERHAAQYAKLRIVPSTDNGVAMCAERLQTLRNTQAAVGDRAFQRVLYEVVAPTVVHSESSNAPDRATQLLRTARGCP